MPQGNYPVISGLGCGRRGCGSRRRRPFRGRGTGGSRTQEHIFFLLSKKQLLEQASLLFQTFSLQECTNIQAVVEMHGMRLGGASRHVEDEQTAWIEQGRQELQLRGEVGQMFEHVE